MTATPPVKRYRGGRLKDLSPLPPPAAGEAATCRPPKALKSLAGFKRSQPLRGCVSKLAREAAAKK